MAFCISDVGDPDHDAPLLLSGAWIPPEAMPAGLRRVMYISPLYCYIEMFYSILLKGGAQDPRGFSGWPYFAWQLDFWIWCMALKAAIWITL